jgi:hypothetical protein
MLVVEYDKVELDYCHKCKGVWFDAGELELLLETGKQSTFIATMLQAEEACCAEVKRKCPLCAQKMKKSNIGQEPQVLVDVCPRGDGIWFDGGEVGHLLQQTGAKPSEPGAQKIVGFIEEVFKAEKKGS